MARKITFKGEPLTLIGRFLTLNTIAPNFIVSAQDLRDVSLLDFKDKIKVISSFPSLDTEICDLQVKEFNKRSVSLSKDIVIIGISKDLPFAQKRFCLASNIKNIQVLSDYKSSSFGINYGFLIKELNLLGRAAIILDKNNMIRYMQIANEVADSLDFDAIIKNLTEVIKKPSLNFKGENFIGKCEPCKGIIHPLPKEQLVKLLTTCKEWELKDDKKLIKIFKFSDFKQAKYFLDIIACIVEEEGHHPEMSINYNKLQVILTTHAAKGLTKNDFIMANIIDQLGE